MGLSRKPWEPQTYWNLYYLILTPNLEIQLYLTNEESILRSKELKTPRFLPCARAPALVAHLYNHARLHQHWSEKGSETRTSGYYTCTLTSPKLPGVPLRLWKLSNVGYQMWRWYYTWDSPNPGTKSLPCQQAIQENQWDLTSAQPHCAITGNLFYVGKIKLNS